MMSIFIRSAAFFIGYLVLIAFAMIGALLLLMIIVGVIRALVSGFRRKKDEKDQRYH